MLILIILFQQPAKGGMGTVFGGGESIFGGSGAAPFMTKLTTGVAIAFVVTSLALVLMAVPRNKAQQQTRPAPTQQTPTAPEAPNTPAPTGTPATPEGGTGGD
jgi:preprotein translocase subunit SecG